MSKIADAEANATSLDGLVNDNGLITTLRNGPKPSYQYLVDGWDAQINAELERTAGVGRDNTYETATAGLAATVDGDYFSVISTNDENYLDLYKNDSGVAAYKKSYPSSDFLTDSVTAGDDSHAVSSGAVYSSSKLLLSSILLTGGVLDVGSELSYGVVKGKFINRSGVEEGFAVFSCSTYIPVIEGRNYIVDTDMSGNAVIAYYDATASLISIIDSDQLAIDSNVLTPPIGAYFVRVSYTKDYLMTIKANEDILYPSYMLESLQKSELQSISMVDLEAELTRTNKSLFTKEVIFGGDLSVGDEIIVSTTSGSYINSKGTLSTFSPFSYSMYIPVVPSAEYLVDATVSGDAHIAVYNDNLGFIQSFNSTDVDSMGGVITIPSNAQYMRVSFVTSGGLAVFANSSIRYSNAVQSRQIETSKTVGEMFEVIDVSSNTESGYYLASDGEKDPLAPYSYVTIDVSAGDLLYISGFVEGDARLHNANGSVYPSSNPSSLVAQEDMVYIEEDGVLNISYITANPFFIKKGTFLDGLVQMVDNRIGGDSAGYDRYRVFHRNMLCIGDSLTNGANYDVGGTIQECYPYYLNLRSHWKVTNAGYSGYSSLGIWNEYISEYNGADYDGVVIWLGTNDGLTDTIDADTVSGDYLTYADTETGRYCSIIEKLLNENPKLKFYLMSVFVSSSAGPGLVTTNEVIVKIAERYDMYALECNPDNVLFPAPDIHKYNNIHFDKIGNEVISNTFYSAITKNIGENIQDYDVVLYGQRSTRVFDN